MSKAMDQESWLRRNMLALLSLFGTAILAVVAEIAKGWVSALIRWLGESITVPHYVVAVPIVAFLAMTAVAVCLYHRYARPPKEYTEGDIVGILSDWFAQGNGYDVIHYCDLDQRFRFVPGSTKKHIKTAAAKHGFITASEGQETISFTSGPSHGSRQSPYPAYLDR